MAVRVYSLPHVFSPIERRAAHLVSLRQTDSNKGSHPHPWSVLGQAGHNGLLSHE